MLRIGIFILIFSHLSFSQFNNELTPPLGCYDDNFTMEVGMSLYDPTISNCQEAILYLNDFGYGCDTYLSEINNPFWGSSPNETIANICGCTCEEIVIEILGCTDLLACNYNLLATEDDGSCIYADLGFDCEGACLNDIDNDGICDEIDNCIGTWIEDIETGMCNMFEDESTCISFGCSWTNEYTGVWLWEDVCGWGNQTYEIDNSYCEELDDCVGEYDECGICNGNGPAPYYDCDGNCINDLDNDEVCDELDDCVGEYDECGACNGNGPAPYYDCNGNCISDIDIDEVCDELDNCPEDYNPNQEDDNIDGIGDACDGIGLDEGTIERTLIKVVDLLGRDINKKNKDTLLLYIYDDGSVEKKYIIE